MHITILLLFLYYNLDYSNAFRRCCQGKNVIINEKACWDGSNITALSCSLKTLMGSTQEPSVTLEIDTDDDLILNSEVGFYKVTPDKYCMTKESENDTDLALVCVENDDEILTDAGQVIFFYLKSLSASISVIFLLVVLLIYVLRSELQDIEGIGIINFVLSMGVVFIIVALQPALIFIDPFPCDTLSFVLYTGTLASINWMCVLSFNLWRITIRPIFDRHMRWTLIYCIYGYGLPILLITTALIVHNSQQSALITGEKQCLSDIGNLVVFVYFYGPILILISISLILQLWVAKKIWWDINRSDQSQSVARLRKKSLMYSHLLLVMGSTYILDVISYITIQMDTYLDYIWNITDCRNLLLGGVLFCIFVAMRNKVLKVLSKKGLLCLKFPRKWQKLIDEESDHIEAEEAALTRDTGC